MYGRRHHNYFYNHRLWAASKCKNRQQPLLFLISWDVQENQTYRVEGRFIDPWGFEVPLPTIPDFFGSYAFEQTPF